MKAILAALTLILLSPAAYSNEWAGYDVVFLGERHDNPHHHRRQAAVVAQIAPGALVFEMLTPDQSRLVTPRLVTDEDALDKTLSWSGNGWPDFSMYYPIFTAAPAAAYYGAAVPRQAARAAMSDVADAFGPDAREFGLTHPLPGKQQSLRETLQAEAHCGALPPEMLPMMVSVQRLRDATLAAAALKAHTETGGPVVVITGNGHARTDWGAPFVLAGAAPGLRIFSLGQSEDNADAGGVFDAVKSSPAILRDDPCDAFLNNRGN